MKGRKQARKGSRSKTSRTKVKSTRELRSLSQVKRFLSGSAGTGTVTYGRGSGPAGTGAITCNSIWGKRLVKNRVKELSNTNEESTVNKGTFSVT